ncbi:MAG: hypothetical protein K940chlam2_01171 [Chlamydiae bacterium]|nr:hypothetical protein [Chlamydiota bacterium]
MKLKVLYFSVTSIGIEHNGGTICCRNHIKRLSCDPGIDLSVVIASNQDQEASLAYLESLNVQGSFHPLHPLPPSQQKSALQQMFQLPWREYIHNQEHIDHVVSDAMASHKADILLIDYFYSAMFCPKAIKAAPKTILVNLNREAEFYKDLLRSAVRNPFKRAIRSLALVHLWWLHQRTFRAMDKIIALSPPDVVRGGDTYITPYLDTKEQLWKPNASRTVFFVGNVNHFPNKMAIEYIVTKLAPAVVALVPDVRFKIIGANAGDLPYQHDSVDFLGTSDDQEVEKQFLNCQLFICPVKNTFGLKFKLAQALAYGTPFLACPESLQCLPHLKGLPTISLQSPGEAAQAVAAAIKDKESTLELATNIQERQRQFIDTQKGIWSRALSSL